MKNTLRNSTALLCLAFLLAMALLLSSCAASGADMDKVTDNYYAESAGGISGSLLDGEQLPEEGETARKIIKTVRLNAETREFDSAITAIEQLCHSANGYIEASSVRGTSLHNGKNSRSAEYTLRIPSGSLDAFQEEMGGLLNIVSSTSNADEITNTYYDIKSRIEVLELQKASLQEMYDNYTNYKDVDSLISLQDKLFSVIEEIEAYETQIRLYDDKVAYSTVYLSLTEVIEYTEEKDESFGRQILDALEGGWNFVVKLCRGIAIVIAAILPFALISGTVVFLIALLCVISSKRKRAKREKENNTENNENT